MAESKSSSSSSLLIATLILLFQALALLVFLPSGMINHAREVEIAWLESLYSAPTIIWIAESTHALYTLLIIETGIAESLEWAFFPPNDATTGVDSIGREFWFPYLEGRAQALEALVHLILVRLVSLSAWLPLYGLVLVPAVLDGLFERSIKQYTFSYPSPIAHRIGIRSVAFLIFLTLAGLLSPIPIPPLVLPMALAIATATIGIAVVGNLPKKL